MATCPACGAKGVDYLASNGSTLVPQPGDISVCTDCVSPFVFVAVAGVSVPVLIDDAIRAVIPDERWDQVVEAQTRVVEFMKRGGISGSTKEPKT